MHKARKRFGQNFLTDDAIISNLLGHLQISENQHWVEIGPGLGALTAPLLAENIQLDVVELDRDLVELLQKRFGHNPRLSIHSADALKFDFAQLAKNDEKLRIIGNLPYNISTPLLFHLLDYAAVIEDMHFMLQKEVVNRICATPGSKKYGRLSVMLQYYCTAEFLFDAPPECFQPAPKVMSAIVKLTPHETLPDHALSHNLNQIVTQAFSQRRKTLRNALSKLLTEQEIRAADIAPDLRAESLSQDDFIRLANVLSTKEKQVTE
ncbi:16S rRNA (adenine(1518)-N(6)/adenine(1519)-N(6))-dimethyltransferase RsmA [methane-oxidizing endosymbiont of Gigantopelta aegis]|uniref:16S rRNA (adenine(1518)-N(6)/adenine(1519)-N(6))- dimethyltransferase RsmA n=1 Tax=methane-oxidizing endosymbiont of Gigantopelta aegis TaxID=2794938 RepID=UPI0018DB7FD3|nr:16S rRNA (adenine(1518)-N(6)/adenine(1519)-N(6))-dimethyltransferase RsmA [methane-oxidizing endosymbiont of Gigantopelta aegis]